MAAAQAAGIDVRKTLCRNIYLSGGGSLVPGLPARLELELSKLLPPSSLVTVHHGIWLSRPSLYDGRRDWRRGLGLACSLLTGQWMTMGGLTRRAAPPARGVPRRVGAGATGAL